MDFRSLYFISVLQNILTTEQFDFVVILKNNFALCILLPTYLETFESDSFSMIAG